jgi:maltose O-acetyltransferase
MRTEKEKMLAGELYRADTAELQANHEAVRTLLHRYNTAPDLSAEGRRQILQQLFASAGEGINIRPPFHCDYGYNISVGAGVFMNFNCVILDVVSVSIGDMTQIGPAVQILAADHPRDPAQRTAGLESGKPVVIGRNVWIGAGAIILPGVRIGDNAIVGAGSVVTREVPEGATVVGNPARQIPRSAQATPSSAQSLR